MQVSMSGNKRLNKSVTTSTLTLFPINRNRCFKVTAAGKAYFRGKPCRCNISRSENHLKHLPVGPSCSEGKRASCSSLTRRLLSSVSKSTGPALPACLPYPLVKVVVSVERRVTMSNRNEVLPQEIAFGDNSNGATDGPSIDISWKGRRRRQPGKLQQAL